MKAALFTGEIAGRLEGIDPMDSSRWRKWGPGFGCEVWEMDHGHQPVYFSSKVVTEMIHRPGLYFVTDPVKALAIAKQPA